MRNPSWSLVDGKLNVFVDTVKNGAGGADCVTMTVSILWSPVTVMIPVRCDEDVLAAALTMTVSFFVDTISQDSSQLTSHLPWALTIKDCSSLKGGNSNERVDNSNSNRSQHPVIPNAPRRINANLIL